MLFYTWMIKNHLKDNSAKGASCQEHESRRKRIP